MQSAKGFKASDIRYEYTPGWDKTQSHGYERRMIVFPQTKVLSCVGRLTYANLYV